MSGSRIYRELTEAELHAVLSAHLPGGFTAHKLTGGMFNTTSLIVTQTGERYVLRMGPVNRQLLLPFEHTLMQGEVLFHQLANQVGVPTSEVVICDTSRALIDRDYMLIRYISGLPMTSREVPEHVRPALQQQVGQMVAALHRVTGTEFGRLSQIAAGQGCSSWRKWLLRAVDHWYSRVEGLLPDEERQSIVELYHRHSPLLDAVVTPHLVHADLWDGNVLVRPSSSGWELAAIIDGDRALFGDPDFEFASGWMMTDAFYAGYGARPAEDPDSQRRRLLYKLLYELNDFYIFLEEYDKPQDSAAHLAQARALIARLKV